MEKVAVIGTGFISLDKHLPAWLRLRPSARVVALCDVDRDSAERAARQFDVPSAYDDVRAMLEREKPDLVDICTPPRTHADIAVMALEAGSHVLIEKPMAPTVEECERIIEAGLKHDRRVGVAHSELFYPVVTETRRRVERGDIGDLKGMRIFRSTPVSYMTAHPDHWANKLPGGVIGETGPHVVYLTQAFVGPIEDVGVHGRKLMPEYPWSPFDDYRLELMGREATGSAALTYTNHHWAAQVDLWGTGGIIKIDLQSKVSVDYGRSRLSPRTVGVSAIGEAMQITSSALATGTRYLAGRFRNTHEILIREFFRATGNGRSFSVTGEDGRETVRVMQMVAERLNADIGRARGTP